MPIYSNRVTRNTIRTAIRAALAGGIGLLVMSQTAIAQSESSVAGARGGIPAGFELDNYVRYLQTLGKVPLGAWGLRPFSAPEVDSLSKISGAHPWQRSWLFESDSAHHFSVLPSTASTEFNSAFPWGSNDGAVWAGRGLTTSVQGGIAIAWGPATLVVNPIVFRAENTSFTLVPNGHTGNARFADPNFPGTIDLPQRFGNGAYSRFDWGQTTLRVDAFGISAGMSTANQYWGPATTYPIILGNNAAGIPNLFLSTERPTDIWVAKVQARVEYGLESQSNFSPVVGSDTFVDLSHPGTKRFMSGLVVTFSPSAIPALELGAARFFHQAWRGRVGSNELRSPFEGILKNSLPAGAELSGAGNIDAQKNQLATLFGRWVLPKSGFEMYAEYGHEDHNADLRDLESEPDHSRIAMVGFRKVFLETGTTFSAIRGEYIDATDPTLARHRDEGGVYIHTVLRQGHTEYGQLLGAAAGIGSFAGAIIAWDHFGPDGRTTLFVQRNVANDGTTLLTSGVPDYAAAQLSGTMGYERVRLRTKFDFTYGASLTDAKRAESVPRSLNLNVVVKFTPHSW